LSKALKYVWSRISAQELGQWQKENKAKVELKAFLQESWTAVYGDQALFYCAKDDQETIAFACLFDGKLKWASALITPPFAPNNGFQVLPLSNPNAQVDRKKLMESFVALIDEEKMMIKHFAFPVDCVDLQAFYWKKFKITTRYTYQIDLSASEDDLFQRMDSKLRNVIRKAEKDELVCSMDTSLGEEGMALILEANLELSENQRKDLVSRLESVDINEQLFVYKAHQKGVLKAVNVVCQSLDTHYYLFSGFQRIQAHNGAGPALIWLAIKSAKAAGMRVFDFEGSMLPDVERYFRKFGGELIPYYSVSKAPLLIESILKLKKRNDF
jgi:hypothetical protein